MRVSLNRVFKAIGGAPTYAEVVLSRSGEVPRDELAARMDDPDYELTEAQLQEIIQRCMDHHDKEMSDHIKWRNDPDAPGKEWFDAQEQEDRLNVLRHLDERRLEALCALLDVPFGLTHAERI